MKATAEKSTTAAIPAWQVQKKPFFNQAGVGCFFSPVTPVKTSFPRMKMTVSRAGDRFEQEADKMADRVMKMPAYDDKKIKEREGDMVQKKSLPEEKVQKKENGEQSIGGEVHSAILNRKTGGDSMQEDVKGYMEPRFGADFSKVKIHSDEESAGLSNRLGARAFTHQGHIFFARNQYQPGTSDGKILLAHELTHTIQQGHSIQRKPEIASSSSVPQIQRLGVRDALDYFADKAYHIPGFRLLTILMGFNPVNMRPSDRNAANILRALIELLPGGHLISQVLENHGVFNKAGDWVEKQLNTLGNIGSGIVSDLKNFMNQLSWTDVFNLGGLWERAKAIFTNPVSRLVSFAGSIVAGILKLIKSAILKSLAALAQGTRGYDLLKAVLGEDPVTGEKVPRSAETLIGGFMKLIGQEDIWENIKKGNAIARAWSWFQGALSGLMTLVRAIPKRIVEVISSLSFQDIVTIVGAFGKIAGVFANIAADFIRWGISQVISLLEILFSVVAPGVVQYIAKGKAVFTTILKNPVAFFSNLVRAGKTGFQKFALNIMAHLKAALINWITGPLGEAGVYIPKSFDLTEIIKLVLSVFGLTWQNIRTKLVRIIPEPVLAGLEKTASILVTLAKNGPAAAWEQIKTELSELKDQLIGKVTELITSEIVKAATLKLASMLSPVGAVIQAIIAIYNTITFFIQKINQITAVVTTFIDSISEIAIGQVANAAKKVEQTMANTLVLVLSFMAKFIGLGKIPEKLVAIIKKIRKPIDKGIEKIVDWISGILAKLTGSLKDSAGKLKEWWRQKKLFRTKNGEQHYLKFAGGDKNAIPIAASKSEKPVKDHCDDFEKRSSLPGASDEQKRGKSKISRTRETAKKDPNDPNLLVNLQELFETFALKRIHKKTEYKKRTGQLAGTTVGLGMSIDWLGEESAKGGTPPEGGAQNKLMSLLITQPLTGRPGEEKYVRGHLLNENMGGKGIAENLFPITGYANSQHLHSTEKIVKEWLKIPDCWIKYEVNVQGVSSKLDGLKENNYVNSDFACYAELKNAEGNVENRHKTLVPSKLHFRKEAIIIEKAKS